MGTRFNLLDEAWIPIAGAGKVGLLEVFSNPALPALGGTPVQKIALTKLLLAIAQAAWTPVDEAQWQGHGMRGLAERTLSYLEQWRDQFYLYGNAPFLQMPAIAKAEKQSFGAVLAEVSTGNTTVLSQFQSEKGLDDADRALLLVGLMGFALGGKKTDNTVVLASNYHGKSNAKGNASTGRPGPSVAYLGLLHSFCLGPTLLHTIWLNVLTIADLANINMLPGGLGVAPWEAMPASEACSRAQALQNSLMGRLVPVSRFCLLADDGLHYSEGIAYPGYKEGVVDPTVTVNYSGKDAKVLWANPERRPWRELTALLSFLQHQGGGFECLQLRVALPRASHHCADFAIWSGGLRVSSNAGEQYVSGTDDSVESAIWLHGDALNTMWFETMKAEMTLLEAMAKTVYACTCNYYKQLLKEGESAAAHASNVFWQLCERNAQQLADSCEQGETFHAARERLRRRFAGYVGHAYAQFCPSDTARQLDAWAQTKPNLSKLLMKEKK